MCLDIPSGCQCCVLHHFPFCSAIFFPEGSFVPLLSGRAGKEGVRLVFVHWSVIGPLRAVQWSSRVKTTMFHFVQLYSFSSQGFLECNTKPIPNQLITMHSECAGSKGGWFFFVYFSFLKSFRCLFIHRSCSSGFSPYLFFFFFW